ncbi:MAG: DUF4249 family protein [Bacteroidota bacterium]
MKVLPLIGSLLLSLLLMPACNVEDRELLTDTVIVSGYLYAGLPLDSLRITVANSYSGNTDSLQTLNELVVELATEGESWVLEPFGAGYYRQIEGIVEEGKTYQLSFTHQGERITASTFVPVSKSIEVSVDEIFMEQITGGFGGGLGGTIPDPIEVSWENEGGEYFFVLVENQESEPDYINLLLADRLAAEGIDLTSFRALSEPEITDLYTIDTRRSIQQYGTYRVIVYHVNPAYAALYQSSSNTSLSLVTPPSNIEGGLGIFTGVSGDTAFFDVRQL